jgi:hypothetical protein
LVYFDLVVMLACIPLNPWVWFTFYLQAVNYDTCIGWSSCHAGLPAQRKDLISTMSWTKCFVLGAEGVFLGWCYQSSF